MYTWVDHTAELELHLTAESEAAVFAEAVPALAELLGPDSEAGPADGPADEASIAVSAEAGDPAALLASWIEELLYLAESRAVVPVEAEGIELAAGAIQGSVRCRAVAPRPLVKAVTYHGLTLRRHGERWVGTVVLDV